MGSKRIAVDMMGGDKGPGEVLAAVKLAFSGSDAPEGVDVVGLPEVISPLLRESGLDGHPRVALVPASEVIEMAEKPVQSLKAKPDSSLVRVVERVQNGHCGAAVSCGNTGALMACAALRLRLLPGLGKPAMATVWPGKDTHFVVLDSGANPMAKPEHLVHHAILGNAYAKAVLGLERPRVGLLSIGTEEGKGTDLTNSAHQELRQLGDQIHYVGLIEGFHVFENVVDVVVTDGFTGNIILKTCQSLAKMLIEVGKEEISRNLATKTGGILLGGAMRNARSRVNADFHGGAPLLGLRGNVLKAHGSSGCEAIAGAIRTAARMLRYDFTARLPEEIARANQAINCRD